MYLLISEYRFRGLDCTSYNFGIWVPHRSKTSGCPCNALGTLYCWWFPNPWDEQSLFCSWDNHPCRDWLVPWRTRRTWPCSWWSSVTWTHTAADIRSICRVTQIPSSGAQPGRSPYRTVFDQVPCTRDRNIECLGPTIVVISYILQQSLRELLIESTKLLLGPVVVCHELTNHSNY